jgi:hypothetical protein
MYNDLNFTHVCKSPRADALNLTSDGALIRLIWSWKLTMCPHVEEFNGEAGLFSSAGLAQTPRRQELAAFIVKT